MLGYFALLPAIGFTIIYVFNLRKVGKETFGKKIWWNNLRPIHAFLYFAFAYLAISKNNEAWKVLFADATLGLVSYVLHNAFGMTF